jgi:Asp-tRNA(Asn)/Glu-tRNA(Gln) amidotransferase A subunit family amidase
VNFDFSIDFSQPTVIPLSNGKNFIPSTVLTAAESFKNLPEDTPGRYHSIADYHSLYLSGELTPLAVVESLLPLIRRDVTPKSNHSLAFIASNVEEILQAARESTQRYKDESSFGLLDGIPVGIKDEVDVAGYRTTLGRKMDEKKFPKKTETIWPVQMWEKSGAIVMGKMNMHEVGMGMCLLSFIFIS